MSAGDRPRRSFRAVVHPTRDGVHLVLVLHGGTYRRPTDRVVLNLEVTLGEPLPLDEPGPALLALSDALAQAADNFRPSGRALWQRLL